MNSSPLGNLGYLPSRPPARPMAIPDSPAPSALDSVSLSGRAGPTDVEGRVAEFWTCAFPQLDAESEEAFVAVAARNLASLAWETIKKTFPELSEEDGVSQLLELLRCLSPHSAAHSSRVGELARQLGQELGLSPMEQEELELAGALKELGSMAIDLLACAPEEREDLSEVGLMLAGKVHDIGKLRVPPSILNKAGPLDDQEWALVRLHPAVGAYMLMGIPELAGFLPAVRGHHERWDGRGYPDGLLGEGIPLAARILALADSYDAMTEVRPYRRALSPAQALQEILRGSGGQFDPRLTAAFITMLAHKAA